MSQYASRIARKKQTWWFEYNHLIHEWSPTQPMEDAGHIRKYAKGLGVPTWKTRLLWRNIGSHVETCTQYVSISAIT